MPQKNSLLPLLEMKTDVSEECSIISDIFQSLKRPKNKFLLEAKLSDSVAKKQESEQNKPQAWRCTNKSVNSWETLEEPEPLSLKSFCSETPLTSIHRHLSAAKSKTSLVTTSVPFDKLLNDIKLLVIGIESESFSKSPDATLTFQLRTSLSCDDISDVSEFIEEFLEMGTCFKRLKTFTTKSPFNQSLIFEGFIFKGFCDCVVKFLNHYRDVIHAQEVETLLELSTNTASIRRTLIYLTKFLKIHPTTKSQNFIPTGSDFLGMLYNEYTTIFNYDTKSFFVDLLKCCCQIYFNSFHKWIFHGIIEDPHKESFIYFTDHYVPNTKYFFEKAYQIRKSSVPGFLSSCAEQILLCGKYTMLLKSHNPSVSCCAVLLN